MKKLFYNKKRSESRDVCPEKLAKKGAEGDIQLGVWPHAPFFWPPCLEAVWARSFSFFGFLDKAGLRVFCVARNEKKAENGQASTFLLLFSSRAHAQFGHRSSRFRAKFFIGQALNFQKSANREAFII